MRIRKTLLTEDDLPFYSCRFAIMELFKHKEKIYKYAGLDDADILEILYTLLKKVNFYNEDTISDKSLSNASKLCAGVDNNDMLFVVLALELNGLLWTGDKRLKQGLTQKGFNSFFEIETV